MGNPSSSNLETLEVRGVFRTVQLLISVGPGGAGIAAREALSRPRGGRSSAPPVWVPFDSPISVRQLHDFFTVDSLCGSASLLRPDHLGVGLLGRPRFCALVRRQMSSSVFQKLGLCLNKIAL